MLPCHLQLFVFVYTYMLSLSTLTHTHTHLCVLHRTETPNLTGVISIETCNQGISIIVNSVNMNRLVLKKGQMNLKMNLKNIIST